MEQADQPEQRTREGMSAAWVAGAALWLALTLRAWFAAGDGWAVAALVALAVVIRLPELLGLVHANALGYTAALGTSSPGFVGGQPTIDPNIGFTAQALGTQAARQWFAGQIPWWNPYEGVGLPLAGEMQSAAFFPLTLLLIAPWGQTVLHICLQAIAGVSAYYLLRQMRLSRVAAFTGGALFEFNGVFAWLANAVVNPIPFLPLLLLGVERALASAQAAPPAQGRAWRDVARDATAGWKWIAVALALSLLAGFPEVAYLDGLLAALWAIARLVSLRGWVAVAPRFALKLATGLVVGVAIAAPTLVAFADYASEANLGLHGQNVGALALPNLSLAQYLFPYIYGGIFQYAAPMGVPASWSGIGGYLGATVAFLALLGAGARRDLALRIALVAWIALMVGRSVGAQPFAAIVNHIPLIDSVAVYRYANASWILAAVVLCAFAVDDWRGTARDKLKAIICAAITLGGLCLGALWLAQPTLRALFQNPLFFEKRLVVGSLVVECGVMLALLAALLIGRESAAMAAAGSHRLLAVARARPHALLMGLAAVALTLAYFFYPTLANPRHVTIDTAAIRYLQAHSGYQRFFTLGPFEPNYGAYFDLAGLNHNDVPVSQRWVDYIHTHLDPYADPMLYLNVPRPSGQPSMSDELAARLPAYAAVGVKYVLTTPGDQPFAPLPASQRPTLVYQDAVLWIYQLPDPAPLFGVASGSCRTETRSWTQADVVCAAPATLVYRSLADSGWRATVNGQRAAITMVDGLFQRVALPAGHARVVFTYEPPYARLALLLAAAGLLALAGALALSLRRAESQSAQARALAPELTPGGDDR
jgi:hypothetical protein